MDTQDLFRALISTQLTLETRPTNYADVDELPLMYVDYTESILMS